MQKMTALSNNLGGEAPKNDVFLQVKRFFGRKKYKCAYWLSCQKRVNFYKSSILYEKKYKKSFRNYTDEKAVPRIF